MDVPIITFDYHIARYLAQEVFRDGEAWWLTQRFGQDGWELAAVVPDQSGTYYFKRAIFHHPDMTAGPLPLTPVTQGGDA